MATFFMIVSTIIVFYSIYFIIKNKQKRLIGVVMLLVSFAIGWISSDIVDKQDAEKEKQELVQKKKDEKKRKEEDKKKLELKQKEEAKEKENQAKKEKQLEEKKQKEKAEKEKQKAKKEKQREDDGDITKLSKEPTFEQKTILLSMAQQKFDQTFPYKGSKIRSVLGVLQDWTQKDDVWFYKSNATVVNGFDAKRDVTVEFYITPTNKNSGNVEIIYY